MNSARRAELYRRMLIVAGFFLLIGVVIVVKMVALQTTPGVEGLPDTESRSFEPQRGSVFDANGYLLAVSTTVYDLAAMPKSITDTLGT
ncbi:MAG TPA: hypothetical protein PKJ21_09370, partial [Anaerolineae bacterium]|nr:hypothetical protein [Anaerolineae bacterium]